MIVTRGLVKRYGSVRAVNSIDLDVRRGDIYGFLGANGSGKTTTVRMLLGLVLATSGEIELLGRRMPKSSRAVLGRVGALVEGPAAYGHLSGRSNLALLDAAGPGSRRRGRRSRIADAMAQVGLGDVGRRPVKAYSLGMRQRLGLAAALLRQPELLILDEPTNGLDPQGIREIRELLLDLHRRGTTIFLSSHLLAEVEQLCSRVGVLDRGRLVVQDQLDVLRAPTGNTVLETVDADRAAQLLPGRVLRADGNRLIVRGDDPAAINATLVAAGVRVHALAEQRRSLEEVVMAATEPTGPGGGAPSLSPVLAATRDVRASLDVRRPARARANGTAPHDSSVDARSADVAGSDVARSDVARSDVARSDVASTEAAEAGPGAGDGGAAA